MTRGIALLDVIIGLSLITVVLTSSSALFQQIMGTLGDIEDLRELYIQSCNEISLFRVSSPLELGSSQLTEHGLFYSHSITEEVSFEFLK